MTEPEGRLYFLDGARAIAVILVLFAHINESFSVLFPELGLKNTTAFVFLWNLDLGKIGVFLFFIISGYLIPFAVDLKQEHYLKAFAKRRILRIFPLFILSIPFGLYLEQYLSGKSLTWMDLPLNLMMVPNFFERPFAMGLYWTLQIELWFYVFVGILLLRKHFFHSSWGIPIVFVVLSIIAEVLRGANRDINSFELAEFAKIIGILAFMFVGSLLRKVFERNESRLEMWILGIYVIYLCGYLPLKIALHVPSSEGPLLSSLSPALAILTFCCLKTFPNLTNSIKSIGKVSYSIYLVHGLVINYFLVFGFKWQISEPNEEILLPYVAYSLTVCALTFALSAATYRAVERPFINIGAR